MYEFACWEMALGSGVWGSNSGIRLNGKELSPTEPFRLANLDQQSLKGNGEI